MPCSLFFFSRESDLVGGADAQRLCPNVLSLAFSPVSARHPLFSFARFRIRCLLSLLAYRSLRRPLIESSPLSFLAWTALPFFTRAREVIFPLSYSPVFFSFPFKDSPQGKRCSSKHKTFASGIRERLDSLPSKVPKDLLPRLLMLKVNLFFRILFFLTRSRRFPLPSSLSDRHYEKTVERNRRRPIPPSPLSPVVWWVNEGFSLKSSFIFWNSSLYDILCDWSFATANPLLVEAPYRRPIGSLTRPRFPTFPSPGSRSPIPKKASPPWSFFSLPLLI